MNMDDNFCIACLCVCVCVFAHTQQKTKKKQKQAREINPGTSEFKSSIKQQWLQTFFIIICPRKEAAAAKRWTSSTDDSSMILDSLKKVILFLHNCILKVKNVFTVEVQAGIMTLLRQYVCFN